MPDILISTRIINKKNKTYKTFVKYISDDFRKIQESKPHKYIKTCWEKYIVNCPIGERTQSLNGKIFETIVATCLYREGILPMFMQARITFVPNVDFDIVLFKEEKYSPIGISIKTSLRERYKQADLEAVALKYVHRNAENYLISLKSSEVDIAKRKMREGCMLGLNKIIAADTEEFDELIFELKKQKFINPGQVPIIDGILIKLGEV
ncbi:MAG: hypothetical protein E7510_13150 [Ruminococcus sp.]|nr:hypothetical protein [Ruminococcus sp.]